MIEHVIQHVRTAIELLAAGHALALAIVNLTKTPKDNEAVAKAYRLVEIIAGLVTPRAKM